MAKKESISWIEAKARKLVVEAIERGDDFIAIKKGELPGAVDGSMVYGLKIRIEK